MKRINGKIVKIPILLFLFVLMLLYSSSLQASENEVTKFSEEKPIVNNDEDLWTEEELDNYFSSFDDSQLIIEMPNGGFIAGEGDIEVYDYTGNLKKIYNTETDSKAETVSEAKKRLLNQPHNYE